MRTNVAIATRYAAHAEANDLRAITNPPTPAVAPTWARVSLVVPSPIHRMLGTPSEAGNHNEGSAAAAGSEDAYARMLDAAKDGTDVGGPKPCQVQGTSEDG